MDLHTADLCAGLGGMSLGLQLAGIPSRTVLYVEREAFCQEHLVQKMRQGTLDPAPLYSDLALLPGRPWRGVVDLLAAGLPCQPYSCAGSGRGSRDPRDLVASFLRLAKDIQPSLLFIENTPPFVSKALPGILEEVAELGFDAEWGLFSAFRSGAPHLRKRAFLLAATDSGRELLRNLEQRVPGRWEGQLPNEGAAELGDDGEEGVLASGPDPDGWGLQGIGFEKPSRVQSPCRSEPDGLGPVRELDHAQGPDPKRQGLQKRGPIKRAEGEESSLGGVGWWAAEPDVGRVADGAPNRVDRLRALGNGVVPAVVARAFLTLATRITG